MYDLVSLTWITPATLHFRSEHTHTPALSRSPTALTLFHRRLLRSMLTPDPLLTMLSWNKRNKTKWNKTKPQYPNKLSDHRILLLHFLMILGGAFSGSSEDPIALLFRVFLQDLAGLVIVSFKRSICGEIATGSYLDTKWLPMARQLSCRHNVLSIM